MATTKIQMTKDYRLFERSPDNRPFDLKKHKKLRQSMERYGFLKCFPIVVRRVGSKLIVKDGQHRLGIAESLGLPVYWVEEETDFDIADINCTPRVWVLRDYAEKHAMNGLPAYHEGLNFAARYGLPIGTAFALLAGTASFNNCQDSFIDGTFEVKDRPWADAVAGIYGPLAHMSSDLNNTRFIQACMSVCRVADFDAKRLLQGAARCRDKLLAYSTKDAYLVMLEEVYNYGRSKVFPLKVAATMAMRERCPMRAATNGKKSKEPVAV